MSILISQIKREALATREEWPSEKTEAPLEGSL